MKGLKKLPCFIRLVYRVLKPKFQITLEVVKGN